MFVYVLLVVGAAFVGMSAYLVCVHFGFSADEADGVAGGIGVAPLRKYVCAQYYDRGEPTKKLIRRSGNPARIIITMTPHRLDFTLADERMFVKMDQNPFSNDAVEKARALDFATRLPLPDVTSGEKVLELAYKYLRFLTSTEQDVSAKPDASSDKPR